MKYLLDTYALIEIIKGNSNYTTCAKRITNHTSLFNLYKLYYIFLRDYDEEKAKRYFDYFKKMVLEIEDIDIFLASSIKKEHKHLSYADCIGYAVAINRSMLFVTGDKEFEKLHGVEFIK